jgi:DNA-directed RNA polymerase specialized sigma subunit
MSNYIDNNEFYRLIVEYKEKCDSAATNSETRPRIPEKIGECFLMIATRLASKSNFSGYTYKDEMISDGLENCIVAVHSFDPTKSKNPFAYFTQIIWYAFLRRIEKEKKQTYIKWKSLENFAFEMSFSEDPQDQEIYATIDLTNEKMIPIIEKYSVKSIFKKDIKTGLEKFISND